MSASHPATIVQRQLDAYNARDLPAYLATFAADAEQLLADGALLARGHDAIGARLGQRFQDARLRADLLRRVVLGDAVVDHERVTRSGAHGTETVEMVCLYVVRQGVICRATFAFGEPQPGAQGTQRPG